MSIEFKEYIEILEGGNHSYGRTYNRAGFSAPEIVKAVFANKNILIFEDLRVQKLFEAPIQLLRANNKQLKPGDGFFVTAAGVSRVKTPLQK